MSELFSAIVGGIFAVIGVLIGSSLSKKVAKSQDDRRMLAEFYAEVFMRYFMCIPDWSTSNVVLLASAAEKAKLLCTKESTAILNELVLLATDTTTSYEKAGECIERLRVSSKNDLQNR